MAFVEPAACMALLEEAPDVLDVRVRERVVVVVPVHPHAEASRLVRDDLRVVGDAFLAALRELGEAVRLDVSLRAEPERLLDPTSRGPSLRGPGDRDTWAAARTQLRF